MMFVISPCPNTATATAGPLQAEICGGVIGRVCPQGYQCEYPEPNFPGGVPAGGMTPLMHADNGNAAGVARAILAKLDPKTIDTPTNDGITPLIAAVSVGARDVVWQLIEKGAKIDLYDLQGRTPLIHAASRQFPGTAETVKLLLEMGANPAARDKDGKTALSEAQQRGSADVVALLKKASAK